MKKYRKPIVSVTRVELENHLMAGSITGGGDANIGGGSGDIPPTADAKENGSWDIWSND